jgi:hypothetical protein
MIDSLHTWLMAFAPQCCKQMNQFNYGLDRTRITALQLTSLAWLV